MTVFHGLSVNYGNKLVNLQHKKYEYERTY